MLLIIGIVLLALWMLGLFARIAGGLIHILLVIALIPVVGWLYGLVDALMIFRDSRKCLHDNIADTIVVKA